MEKLAGGQAGWIASAVIRKANDAPLAVPQDLQDIRADGLRDAAREPNLGHPAIAFILESLISQRAASAAECDRRISLGPFLGRIEPVSGQDLRRVLGCDVNHRLCIRVAPQAHERILVRIFLGPMLTAVSVLIQAVEELDKLLGHILVAHLGDEDDFAPAARAARPIPAGFRIRQTSKLGGCRCRVAGGVGQGAVADLHGFQRRIIGLIRIEVRIGRDQASRLALNQLFTALRRVGIFFLSREERPVAFHDLIGIEIILGSCRLGFGGRRTRSGYVQESDQHVGRGAEGQSPIANDPDLFRHFTHIEREPESAGEVAGHEANPRRRLGAVIPDLDRQRIMWIVGHRFDAQLGVERDLIRNTGEVGIGKPHHRHASLGFGAGFDGEGDVHFGAPEGLIPWEMVLADPSKQIPFLSGSDAFGRAQRASPEVRSDRENLASVLDRGFRAKVLSMDKRSTYLAFGMFCATLLGWRGLYGEGDFPQAGMASLAILGLVSLVGGYRISVRRRRAFLSAALEPDSQLSTVLTGRMGASLAALLGTAATLPVVAYFALTASEPELYLAAGAAAWAVAMTLLIERLTARHFRQRYRMSAVVPIAIGIAAAPVVLLAMAFAFWVLPIPAYAEASALPDAISAGLEGLPRHHPLVFEAMSVLRVADASIYWVLAQDGFRAGLPVLLFLLKGAVVYLSVAKLAVDCQAALLRREDRP